MTRIRSQSTKGRSASGCLFFMLRKVLVMAPPNMVMLDSGTAYLGLKRSTRMKMGTRMPPPPIPPAAAIMSPKDARITVATSHLVLIRAF